MLVGHSYGGTLALAYAERRPQDVRGLVLVDAAAAGERSGAFQRAQSHLVQFLSWPVVQPVADATFSQLLRTVSAKQARRAAFDPGDVDPATSTACSRSTCSTTTSTPTPASSCTPTT